MIETDRKTIDITAPPAEDEGPLTPDGCLDVPTAEEKYDAGRFLDLEVRGKKYHGG